MIAPRKCFVVVSGPRRLADGGGNESLPQPLFDIPVSAVTATAQRQRLEQPVGGCLPSKIEKINKAKRLTHIRKALICITILLDYSNGNFLGFI